MRASLTDPGYPVKQSVNCNDGTAIACNETAYEHFLVIYTWELSFGAFIGTNVPSTAPITLFILANAEKAVVILSIFSTSLGHLMAAGANCLIARITNLNESFNELLPISNWVPTELKVICQKYVGITYTNIYDIPIGIWCCK